MREACAAHGGWFVWYPASVEMDPRPRQVFQMLSPLLLAISVAASPQAAPTAPPTITVEQAVSTVLARSPSRQSAAARLEAARNAAESAGTWPNPTVELRSENWTFGSWHWTPPPEPGSPPMICVLICRTICS